MKLSELKIDPEFQGKIPPMVFDEEHQLEMNIIEEGGLLNPIIVWNGIIVDGHTRYRILKKHPFLRFDVQEKEFANRYEAIAWICKNQLGRRNLDPDRRKYLIGKKYEAEKLSVGGQPENENRRIRCGQNDHIVSSQRTCEKIAVENGISPKSVRRAEQYAMGVDAAEDAVEGAKEEILTGRITATDDEIASIAKAPKEKRSRMIAELRKDKKKRDTSILPQPKASPPRKPDPSLLPAQPKVIEDISSEAEPEAEQDTAEQDTPPFEATDIRESIRGQKRELSEKDREMLRASISNRYFPRAADTGALHMCEVQGAKEDFIRRWNNVFRAYPDILEDESCRAKTLALIEDTIHYLQMIKEENRL